MWRKQGLAPGRAINCRRCGVRVSVSRLRWIPVFLFMVLFPMLVLLAWLDFGSAIAGGITALGLIVMGLYQHFLVPLVVRSQPKDE